MFDPVENQHLKTDFSGEFIVEKDAVDHNSSTKYYDNNVYSNILSDKPVTTGNKTMGSTVGKTEVISKNDYSK